MAEELTTEEAASLLGLSPTLVAKLCDGGKLPCRHDGASRRIPTSAVQQMLDERDRRSRQLDEMVLDEEALGVR